MQNNSSYFNINILKSIFDEDNSIFLSTIIQKRKQIIEDIKDIKLKKRIVNKKISKYARFVSKNTFEYRELKINSESVLESVNSLHSNLNELKECFSQLEKDIIKYLKKSKDNYALPEIKEMLIQETEKARELEKKLNDDNDKNYLIVNNYIYDTPDEKAELQEINRFYNLTLENLEDNPVLKICEKRVELPYTKKEVEEFMKTYPNEYKTVQDVISKEFIISISIFKRHPILARFKESYYLCRTKEMMTITESLNYAKGIMFRKDINPYIVAAVKSKKQLEDYIECVEKNDIESYSHFKIVYSINPLAV